MRSRIDSIPILFLLLAASICASQARADFDRYGTFFAGALTTGSWHDAVRPWEVEFAEAWMIGASVGWDRSIGTTPIRWGIEAQLSAHVGRQDHFELSVPMLLRYRAQGTSPVRSLAAGLGLSYASKVPQVEIDRNGASQRLFVHWMAEIEFGAPNQTRNTVLRLHHRSDGYGLFDVDAGSTAIVVGLRKRF